MSAEVISIGSSSSGNSYIIRAGGRVIVMDVGLPAKTIMAALEELGFGPEDVDAVFISHEHTDHVKSVRAVGRKCFNATFYASRGTVEKTTNFKYISEDRIRLVCAGDSFVMDGDVAVDIFPLSHDAAEPVGFAVTHGGEKLAVVTDCGIITEEIYAAISDADTLVFEANHDENLLMYGEYPYPLKLRIKSDFGHLSNEYAGEVLARMLEDRCGNRKDTETTEAASHKPLRIMLAHLSFNNNAAYIARQAVEDILGKRGFEKDRDYMLDIAAKEGMSFLSEPDHPKAGDRL